MAYMLTAAMMLSMCSVSNDASVAKKLLLNRSQ